MAKAAQSAYVTEYSFIYEPVVYQPLLYYM